MPRMMGNDIYSENMYMRSLLKRDCLIFKREVGSASATALGQTLRVKLENSGITVKIGLLLTVPVSITTSASSSPNGWARLFDNVLLRDYDGTNRINANGMQIFKRNSVRERFLHGLHKAGLIGISGGDPSINAGNYPAIPTAAGAGTITAYLELPVAVDPEGGDLTGALWTQTNQGEVYVNVTLPNILQANGDDTKVYNTANAVVFGAGAATLRVIQWYLQPQTSPELGTTAIPQLDVTTYLELVGATSTSDLAAGAEKLLQIPPAKQIMGFYYDYIHNGVLGGATGNTNNLARHAMRVNGGTYLIDQSIDFKVLDQRNVFGSDFSKGQFFYDFVGVPGSGYSPVQTQLLGNSSFVFVPQTSPTGSTFLDYMFESLVSKGAPTGGISQGA